MKSSAEILALGPQIRSARAAMVSLDLDQFMKEPLSICREGRLIVRSAKFSPSFHEYDW
jgi:hypothetical protein